MPFQQKWLSPNWQEGASRVRRQLVCPQRLGFAGREVKPSLPGGLAVLVVKPAASLRRPHCLRTEHDLFLVQQLSKCWVPSSFQQEIPRTLNQDLGSTKERWSSQPQGGDWRSGKNIHKGRGGSRFQLTGTATLFKTEKQLLQKTLKWEWGERCKWCSHASPFSSWVSAAWDDGRLALSVGRRSHCCTNEGECRPTHSACYKGLLSALALGSW